jgi:hypothetical protein
MEDLGLALAESASAVAALGASREQIDQLDDDSLLAGMRLVREHESHLQRYKLWLAAAVARRSDHELGYNGLARRKGAATPGQLTQSITGTSLEDAQTLANLGEMLNSNDDAPVIKAMATGGLSIAAADAIRRGWGSPMPP